MNEKFITISGVPRIFKRGRHAATIKYAQRKIFFKWLTKVITWNLSRFCRFFVPKTEKKVFILILSLIFPKGEEEPWYNAPLKYATDKNLFFISITCNHKKIKCLGRHIG